MRHFNMRNQLMRCGILSLVISLLCACESSIPNFQGRPFSTADLPKGSYLRTCTNCIINGDTLICNCLTREQQYKTSQITYNTCPNPAAYLQNCDGILSCTDNCHHFS